MKKKRRKRRLIDQKVQLALVSQVIRHWLAFLFGTFVLLSILQMLFGEPNRSLIDHLGAVWSKHALFYIAALLIVPVYVNDVINLSHRFVGPVLRVRGALRRVADGESVSPVAFRKEDFWPDLAADFNAAMATIDGHKTPAGDTRAEDAGAAHSQVEEEAALDHEAQLTV